MIVPRPAEPGRTGQQRGGSLLVTGEHREEPLEPSGAPRARRARRLRTLRDVRGVGPVHQKPSEQTRERGRDGVPTTRVVRVHIGGV